MSDLTFVQGDNAPPINGAILDSSGAPVSLSGATVKFQMRLVGDRRYTVDATAEIVDATAGTVRYTWQDGDLDTAGNYQTQWQVTFAGNQVETTDPVNTVTIRDQ